MIHLQTSIDWNHLVLTSLVSTSLSYFFRNWFLKYPYLVLRRILTLMVTYKYETPKHLKISSPLDDFNLAILMPFCQLTVSFL